MTAVNCGRYHRLKNTFEYLVLVGHVLDVLEEAHRRVLVGVDGVRPVVLDLDQFLERVGAVLVVFAENRPRLGLEVGFGVRQVLEHVGVDGEQFLEVVLRKGGVVGGHVVAGAGILARAGLDDRLLELRGRVDRRAPEHQVLEEVGEARAPRFDLVARPRLHRDLHRHDVREAGGYDDHAQPVRQRRLRGLEGENVGRPGRRRCLRRRPRRRHWRLRAWCRRKAHREHQGQNWDPPHMGLQGASGITVATSSSAGRLRQARGR